MFTAFKYSILAICFAYLLSTRYTPISLIKSGYLRRKSSSSAELVRCTSLLTANPASRRVADTPGCRVVARLAITAASLLLSLDAAGTDAGAAESLARHSGCNKCHAVEKKKDGPALRDVAAKYRGDEQAGEKLLKHVTSGEMVKFDDGHKEEHKKVKTQDLEQTRNLINWILSLEGGTKY
jgi:cytochrome c